MIGEAYDETYTTKKGDDKKDTLTDDELKALREAMIAEVIENALAEKAEDTEEKASIVITEKTEKGGKCCTARGSYRER